MIAAKTVEAEVESTSKGVATAKNTGGNAFVLVYDMANFISKAIANVKLKAKTNSRANKIADANAAQAANANPAPIVEENVVIIPIDKEELARKALTRIERKLNGLFVAYRDKEMESTAPEREVPTNSLVDMLIREATSNAHLVCPQILCLVYGVLIDGIRRRCGKVGVRGSEVLHTYYFTVLVSYPALCIHISCSQSYHY